MGASVFKAGGDVRVEGRAFGAFGDSRWGRMHMQITQSVTREFLVATFAFYVIFGGRFRAGIANVTETHITPAQFRCCSCDFIGIRLRKYSSSKISKYQHGSSKIYLRCIESVVLIIEAIIVNVHVDWFYLDTQVGVVRFGHRAYQRLIECVFFHQMSHNMTFEVGSQDENFRTENALVLESACDGTKDLTAEIEVLQISIRYKINHSQLVVLCLFTYIQCLFTNDFVYILRLSKQTLCFRLYRY